MTHLLTAILLTAALTSCQTKTNTNESSSQQTPIAQTTTWDKAYGGADKAYDAQLLALREEIAPKFQKLNFHDEVTGGTMAYNLYIPEEYDETKTYPLVQFIADASTVGKGIEAPLKQGYGGIIWATEESQRAHPCFVLVPAFAGPDRAVNDQWETSEEVGMAYRLLFHILESYAIDEDKIYTTGQSMGGMISFYLNATYPDLFAASIYVGCQWDINVLQPLLDQNFCYIVSAGDVKASAGMAEIEEMLIDNETNYNSCDFSAKLPQAEQEKLVEAMLNEGDKINLIQFTKGTVVPEGSSQKGAPEHMYSFDYAYQLKAVRDWLFAQCKCN